MSVPLSKSLQCYSELSCMCATWWPEGVCGWLCISVYSSISMLLVYCLGSNPHMCHLEVSPGIYKHHYHVTLPNSFLSTVSPVHSSSSGPLFSPPVSRKTRLQTKTKQNRISPILLSIRRPIFSFLRQTEPENFSSSPLPVSGYLMSRQGNTEANNIW